VETAATTAEASDRFPGAPACSQAIRRLLKALFYGMADPGSARFPKDPVVEAYKRDVDRTLLRENLRKTPEERVLALMSLQRLAEEARRAGRETFGYE